MVQVLVREHLARHRPPPAAQPHMIDVIKRTKLRPRPAPARTIRSAHEPASDPLNFFKPNASADGVEVARDDVDLLPAIMRLLCSPRDIENPLATQPPRIA